MTWFYSVIFDPIRYGDFLNALRQQILNGGDVGYSFYGVLRVFNVSDPVLLAIHGLVSLFLIWLGFFTIPKNLEIENNLVAKFLLATFVIVIINPRMKEYDLFIGVVSFFLLLRGTCPEYKKIILIGLLCSISIWGKAFSKIIFPPKSLWRSNPANSSCSEFLEVIQTAWCEASIDCERFLNSLDEYSVTRWCGAKDVAIFFDQSPDPRIPIFSIWVNWSEKSFLLA
jgi:hypothetical protein